MTSEEEHRASRRKWLAIGVATIVMVFSYSAFVVALVAGEAGGENAAGAFALGAGLAPFVFIALAFVSGHPTPASAVVVAMGVALLFALPVSAVLQDAVTGLAAGFGMGGVFSLRAEESDSLWARAIAVVFVCAYTAILVRFITEGGLIAGATLPLVALGIADSFTDYRRRLAAADGS